MPTEREVRREQGLARQSKPSTAELERVPAAFVRDARSEEPKEPTAGVFAYNGEEYKISEEQGVWPLLQFARAAESGFRTTDPRGLAAIHAFLEDVIDPDDWGRFQEDMISSKVVDLEGLMKAAQEAVNAQLEMLEKAKEDKGE